RVDAELEGDLDGRVELRRAGLACEGDGFAGGVVLSGLDLLGRGPVGLGLLCHLFLLIRDCGLDEPGWLCHVFPGGRDAQPSTVMPMERAVPAMIFDAASMSFALRSTIFCSAMERTCSWVSLPTLLVCGTPEPLGTPAAFLISSAAGGV